MTGKIHALVIPKYGMVMTEGVLAAWHVNRGEAVEKGDDLVDIETEKVANVYESPHSGILRRQLVVAGQSVPVGGLFGIVASPDVDEAAIDTFVDEFRATFAAAATAAVKPVADVIDLGGPYLRFLKLGNGGDETPILLLHGFAGDLNNWLFNHDALASTRSVYAVDLPGHGGSAKNPALASVRELAATVEAFIQAKGLSSVHVVGHSLGGAVATRVAADCRHLVVSLTLIAPVGLGLEINGDFIRGLLNANRYKEMRAVLEMLFHDPGLVTRDMAMNVLQSKRIDGGVECLRAIAEQNFSDGRQSATLREEISKMSLPIQVIWGQSDRVIPKEHVRNLPEATLVHIVERAGHMPHVERSSEVNKLILEFVEARDSRAR